MKKIMTILIAVFAISCSEKMDDVAAPQADYASVSLSSSSVVVEAQSVTKTLFVASNRAEWSAESSADWVDVSVEGNTLCLYVEENNQPTSRLAVIDVTAGEKPDVAKSRLKLLQQGKFESNLSKDGTANCYIAKSGASYRFDASVKGNGKSDGNSLYIENYGVELSEGAYAELLWEATYDGDKTRSTGIIKDEPVYDATNGEIHITTGDSEGNASIALCSAEGEILWSWHIWVTNENVGLSSAKELEWMDRNLGALSNEIGDISNRGMLYQWGRKDPFLPSYVEYMTLPRYEYDDEGYFVGTEEEFYAIQAEIERIRGIVNQVNTQTGDGVLEWSYIGNAAPVAMNAPGNMEYAVQNPTTFLSCRTDIAIGEYVFDWYLVEDIMGAGGYMQQSQSLLWGNGQKGTDYKSIFDPCPPGYVVPPRGAFWKLASGEAAYMVTEEWTLEECGWSWSGGNGDYFPNSGNFDVSGLIGETGEKLLYWTAESFGAEARGFGKAGMLFEAYNEVCYGIYPIVDPAEAAAWYSYGAKCFAAPVRCVKEQK